MAFIDTWRAAIPASLAEFADLASNPQDLTGALTAAAVLWPLREPIRAYNSDAYDTLRAVAGDQAGRLLKIIANWNEDRLSSARELTQMAADDPALQATLTQLIKSFNATKVLTDRLTPRIFSQEAIGTYNINGAIQAALANFGGTITIGQITLASRSEAEDLDTFLREAVSAYQLHLSNTGQEGTNEPYKFLYPFEIKDQAIFFGRALAVEILLDRIFKARLTVVHASSGAGKTSLLRAGLGPCLLDDSYLPVFARTYDDPISAVVNQIANHSLLPRPRLLSNLSLSEFLRRVTDRMGRRTRGLIVVLDQFEEMFTLTSPIRRAEIFDALVECIEDDSLPLRLVLAIRKEYFSDLAAFEPRLPSIFVNHFHLDPMVEQEIREAITRPVQEVGSRLIYNEDLLQELVSVLITDKMDLPELQILCSSLYERAKIEDTGQITLALYVAAGKAQGILSGYLEQAMKRFSAREISTAWKALESLVGSDGQRLIATVAEIARQTSEDAAQIEKILDRLSGARLLRRGDDGLCELVHDYLARAVRERISPAQLEVKLIREALKRAVDDWQADRLLVPPERLLVFHERREILADLDDEVRVCLLLSTTWYDIGVDDWSDQASEVVIQRSIALLLDDRMRVRRYAARALGRFGRLEIIPALHACLENSDDLETKLEVAMALRLLGGAGINILLTLLDKVMNQTTWMAVVETFRQKPDELAAAPLVRTLELVSDTEQITRLALAIEAHNDVQAIPSLIQAVTQLRDRSAQQVLIHTIKILRNNVRAESEQQLRQLINIHSGNIDKLELQSSTFGPFTPAHVIMSLDDSRMSLQRYQDELGKILGPCRVLDEPRIRIRLVSVLGIEKTGELIDGLDWSHILDAMLTVLMDRSNNDMWYDCVEVLRDFYKEVDHLRALLRFNQRNRWQLEYMRAKEGLQATLSVLNGLESAEAEIRRLEDMLQPFDELLSDSEPRLAEVLLDALREETQPTLRSALVDVLGVMGSGAFTALVINLRPDDQLSENSLITVFNSIVEQIKPELDQKQFARRHLQNLYRLHLQRQEYLQEIQRRLGAYLPDGFKRELAETPREVARVNSRMPIADYELRAFEEQLLPLLVGLLRDGVQEPIQRVVILTMSRFSIENRTIVLDALRKIEPFATNILVAHWKERDESQQQIARLLEQLWNAPETIQQIENEAAVALQSLAAATDSQACAVALRVVESLWVHRIQPVRKILLLRSTGNTHINEADEIEEGNEHEVLPLDELLDQLAIQTTELLIPTFQWINDIEIQNSATATLTCLGEKVAIPLSTALHSTAELVRHDALSEAAKQCIKTLIELRNVLQIILGQLDEQNNASEFALLHREQQLANFGSFAPVEVLLDKKLLTNAVERLKSQRKMLNEVQERVEQALYTLETAANLPSSFSKEVVDSSSVPTTPVIQATTQEELASQQEILEDYRETQRILLNQKALLGIYTPPETAAMIYQTQKKIQQIKWALRSLGIAVDDLPEDEDV